MNERHLRQLTLQTSESTRLRSIRRPYSRVIRLPAFFCTVVVGVGVGVGACASVPVDVGIPKALDDAFKPGIVAMDPESCDLLGGSPLDDVERTSSVISEDSGADSGADSHDDYCRIGTPVAIYSCDEDRRIVRLRQEESGQELLQWSGHDFESVSGETSASGSRWSGEMVTVVETEHGVIVTTAEQRSVCEVTTDDSEA